MAKEPSLLNAYTLTMNARMYFSIMPHMAQSKQAACNAGLFSSVLNILNNAP